MGWVGQWPPPPGAPLPPFPGPPPNVAGVSQQAWSDGQWIFNPQVAAALAAGSGVVPPAQGWAPWQWGGAGQQQQQQQQQQNYNPYKRVPKQPDKEYWDTKLSENGLGLQGMDPSKCV
jgi:hypothetical protein